MAVYLAARVERSHNTQEAIRLAEKAKTLDPAMPWPYMTLMVIYRRGKFADRAKTAENTLTYFRLCPATTYSYSRNLVVEYGNEEMQRAVAQNLRARLAGEKDPKTLESYADLWALEFRLTAPVRHPELRRQVSEDLKRLEAANPAPDATWAAFLNNGYRQSGASLEQMEARKDRLLHEFPRSSQALAILTERWSKEHKAPKTEDSEEVWQNHLHALLDAYSKWAKEFPEEEWLKRERFFTAADVRPVDRRLLARLADDFLAWNNQEAYGWVANVLLQHDVDPGWALKLLESGRSFWEEESKESLRLADGATGRMPAVRRKSMTRDELGLDYLFLRAYAKLGRVKDARRLAAEVNGPVPEDRDLLPQYWWNRALLAGMERNKTDALTFYQAALGARARPPARRHGRAEDELKDEAHALWTESGGTEAAWQIWLRPATSRPLELTEGRWEQPKKELPAFELADLSGKVWRLKALEGKTLVINLWATWCGVCQEELPAFQRLYEQTKDRTDMAVFTFNVDDELGLVEPFLKEQGYTFPVVPARDMMNRLLNDYGIPQNWIVDGKGKWQWQQKGFDSSSHGDWVKVVLGKIESVQQGAK